MKRRSEGYSKIKKKKKGRKKVCLKSEFQNKQGD